MPSNPTLPEDVRRMASIELRNHMLGADLPDDECDDCIDLIAPLIIEWARKDALLSAANDMPNRPFVTKGGEIELADAPRRWLRERAQFPTADGSGVHVLRGVVQRSAVTNRYTTPETAGGATK